jgi:rare lipoprotein A
MTDPILRPAGHRQPRIIAGLTAAALLLPLPAASAAAEDDFAEQFAAFDVPAEPVLPPDAVDLDSLAPQIEPETAGRVLGQGMASYYGSEFAGRRTASGERFDPGQLTAAHRTLPFGSKVRVTNPANGRSVVVRINDRGPFTRGRLIDVSRAAAVQLGLIGPGHGRVELALLES